MSIPHDLHAKWRMTGFSDRWRRLSDEVPAKVVIGKFDGSGVSGSTVRGRSQALESKVRFADNTTGINHRWMGNYQFINLILARRNRGNISGGESEVRRTVLDELQDGR